VIDVPIEPNRLVKKGDVLFRIDRRRTNDGQSLEAQLASASRVRGNSASN